MKYEDALKKWGILKLGTHRNLGQFTEIVDVKVDMDFNEGYSCCNGSDPDCYCSFAESPSCNIAITGTGISKDGKSVRLGYNIDANDFDFATMIKELFEVSKIK